MKKSFATTKIAICLLVLTSCVPHHPPGPPDLSPTGDPVADLIIGSVIVGGVIAASIAADQMEKNEAIAAEQMEQNAPIASERIENNTQIKEPECLYSEKCSGEDCECNADDCCEDDLICWSDGSCLPPDSYSEEASTCTRDTDCPGELVCRDNGECVEYQTDMEPKG